MRPHQQDSIKRCFTNIFLLLTLFGVLGGAQATPPNEIPMPVETTQPTLKTLQHTLTTTGTLLAFDSAQIAADIPGRIANIHFKSGTQISAGDLLLELDNTTQVAELTKAEAEVKQNQINYDRAIKLLEKGTGTQHDKDMALANLAIAKAQVSIAEANLAKTKLQAPFAGIIGLQDISVGDYVTPGKTLVNLENIFQLKVDFYLAQTDIAKVEKDQMVQITVDAYPDKTFKSTVSALAPTLDVATRRLQARAIVPNPEALLKPGMFVRLSLVLSEKENALTLPEEAILLEKAEAFIYVVKEKRAVKTRVTTGQRESGWVEILSGLEANDIVIQTGHMRVRDGSLVNDITK